MTTRNSASHSCPPRTASPRGNTLILVVGILVLLVIIATAYISRTQAGLVTSNATQDLKMRVDRNNVIASDLAQIIADALFVREISADGVNDIANGNTTNPRRSPIGPYAVRNGVDFQYPFNYAPSSDYPFTNPPDPSPFDVASQQYPRTPYSPLGKDLLANYNIGFTNPLGGPGFGDNRWERSFEPDRYDPNQTGLPNAFSIWRHLSYIATPDNGYRLCIDIANCNGNGVLEEDLRVPVEQWLPINPNGWVAGNSYATGDHRLPTGGAFWAPWNSWVSFNDYPNVSTDPVRMPANYYHLRDLNGNGTSAEPGERPEDEFIPGTARNLVSRVLADTDGDGFTDAFWFLCPTPIESGIRQVVAVSIIDASAMLDVNVATKFQRTGNDPLIPTATTIYNGFRTRGLTPTDLALVSNLGAGDGATPIQTYWNVGFFDNPDSDCYANFAGVSQFDFLVDNWSNRFAPAIESRSSTPKLSDPTARARLEYWQNSGRFGLGSERSRSYQNPYSAAASQINPFTPFGLSDDLELRMYAGNNYAWIASRFENAVQQTSGGPPNAACFLRGYFGGHEENSELLEQIVNRMQVLDQRHRLTMYSGARNDLMAPWLWLRRDWYDDNPNDSIDPENSPTSPDLPAYYPFDGNTAYSNWDRQYLRRLKIDLRKSVPGTAQPNTKGADYNHDGVVDAQDRLYLRDVLFRCLVDHYNYDPADPPKQSYFGDATNATVLQTTQDAAAAMAANIIAYSDNDDANSAVEITANDILPATAGVTIDDVAPVVDPVAAPAGIFSPVTTESDNQYAFLGVEPQPFLVEAFIGHVYTPNVAPAQDAEGDPYSNAGHNVILDDTSKQATVLVIQIANPFEKTIDLREYALKIGSVTVPLSSPSIVPEFAGSDFPYLRQARDNAPTTAIFYAIPPTLDASNGFDTKWKDFLDIDTQTDLAPYTFVGNMTGVSALLTKRAIYDDINSGQPIELLRMYQGGAVPVVVDRFDIEQPANNDFADAIQELDDNRPEPIPPTLPDASPTGTTPYPGIDIGLPALGYNQWVQYVRVTRAWGVDTTYPAPPVANQYFYPYRDRNPRYVFGDRAVVMAAPSAINTAVGDPDVDGPSYIAGGQRYKFGSSPETGGQNGLPWFTRDYVMLNGELASTYFTQQVANRFDLKPTFFDLRWVDNNPDTTATDRAPLPNKGWYSQSPGTAGHAGSVDDAVTNIRLNFPMQMLQKDKDFDQVGELANVWMFGHKLQFGGGAYLATKETFSEYMADPKLTGDDLYANRLRPSPNTGADAVGQVIGTPTNTANPADPTDVAHLIPDLPAGLRVYDAFVCDGRGMGVNNINNPVAQFYNANNFEQRITPGLINICTAPVEVLRALPHFYRMIWNRNDVALNDANPRTLVAEALVQYREKFNGAQVATTVPPRVSTGYEYGPDYSARTGAMGIQSIGQLLGIRSPAALQTTGPSGFTWFTKLWRSDAASLDPLQLTNAGVVSGGSYISTDVVGGNNRIKNVSNNMISHEDPALLPLDSYTVTAGEIEHTEVGDAVSGDSEEANLLFSGVSNLITTRSDVFVVYFKIRSFREDNSVSPPVWDATKLENIVEDSRYVMLVDRSNVNHPGDKPKILYLEKLPN